MRSAGDNHEAPSSCRDVRAREEEGVGGGGEVLAQWREAGEWWANEPYREVTRFIDSKGIRREEERLLPSIGSMAASGQTAYEEDNTIEVTARARKLRDEKVSAACGHLPTS